MFLQNNNLNGNVRLHKYLNHWNWVVITTDGLLLNQSQGLQLVALATLVLPVGWRRCGAMIPSVTTSTLLFISLPLSLISMIDDLDAEATFCCRWSFTFLAPVAFGLML